MEKKSHVLFVGDPAPLFFAASPGNPNFAFDSVGGRIIVLVFAGSAAHPQVTRILDGIKARKDVFDDENALAFAVSADPQDAATGRLANDIPGFRVFWDFDGRIAAGYGAVQPGPDGKVVYQMRSIVLDENFRVLAIVTEGDPDQHLARIFATIAPVPKPSQRTGSGAFAPVLEVPYVFEPALCHKLIAHYQARGGVESGFMRTDPATGKTVGVYDHAHKRRQDCEIDDAELRAAVKTRIERRIVPALRKAFQFNATVIERYIIARYDGAEQAHFGPHRDNTTKGTAHRRFAVTLNLNAEEYEGGELAFPEYGRRLYKPPTGHAVVFSCSLLHRATPVRSGVRFCVLPFLYDAEGQQIRQRNLGYLEPDQAGPTPADGSSG